MHKIECMKKKIEIFSSKFFGFRTYTFGIFIRFQVHNIVHRIIILINIKH